MPVLNPSFETSGDNPGEAEHWRLVAFTALERIAGFGPEPCRAIEDFERWSEYLDTLDSVNVAMAFFDPQAEGFEDFEDAWHNQEYLTALPSGHVISAPFGGGPVEDMEHGWNNDIYIIDWPEVTAIFGTFDAEPFEDYEEGWRGNQAFAWDWSGVSVEMGPTENFEVW